MNFSENGKLVWDDPRFTDIPSSIDSITKGFGQTLLEQAGVPEYPEDVPLTILDLACGSGVVTEALHETLRRRPMNSFQITSGDLADVMVQKVFRKIELFGWTNTKASKIDAQDTKLPDQHFTHVLTNFGPMLFPDPSAMLFECYRILRPGGVCAFSTWKQVGWAKDFQQAFAAIPDLPRLPNPESIIAGSGQWNDKAYIEKQLNSYQFRDIRIEEVSNVSRFTNLEDLQLVVKLTLLIVSKLWSLEERQKHANQVTEQKVLDWFQQKYSQGQAEWHWVGLLATGHKPENVT